MYKVALVFGTRPEAIKMCPLVHELRSRPDCETFVAVTGQHREMLGEVLAVFGVTPDADLDVMTPRQTLFDITERVLSGMRELLIREKPDILLVHGDTTTSFASALAAYYLGIPVGHVEAGLRTYDIRSPYPEEFNRQAIDSLSDVFFAPTETARGALLREGKRPEKIFVTGNTEIDALKYTVRAGYTGGLLENLNGQRLVIMTAHRRENLGEPMRRMFRAVRRVVDEHPDVTLVYPVHPNPAVREAADEILGGHSRILLTDPLDAYRFHNLMARAYLVLTDSGGIQESAPSLGVPVIVLRDTTERPEGVAAGTLLVAGTSEQGVYDAFTLLLGDAEVYAAMARAENPYGDGFAARRIADALLARINN
ncbi:MAG: UDP-N-acetylglucosamine 2-epimerase (non-hydrolyzing) [Oscillospiraceae bacterium]|jgi:UDP-N-acetylglucosamine 2-epimerase (non-hydrolysing)|nr:UDP-N-acetylglucosamine 2-epimerase (non-hydrolyzing) [Oscillospiraceae bacterium]